jgi:hypothetical protein
MELNGIQGGHANNQDDLLPIHISKHFTVGPQLPASFISVFPVAANQ